MDHEGRKRILAASKVWIGGVCWKNHVVEMTGDVMCAHYPLEGEQAMTEWYQGTIVVDETQHIQLQ